MHLLNSKFFLYELVLQIKGEISSNLYKLLLIQSSVQLLDNKGKVSSLISALESSNLWICFVHDPHSIFSFYFGFNNFSFCNKPLWWERHTGSIKLKDFCYLALGYHFQIQGQFLNIRNAVNQQFGVFKWKKTLSNMFTELYYENMERAVPTLLFSGTQAAIQFCLSFYL